MASDASRRPDPRKRRNCEGALEPPGKAKAQFPDPAPARCQLSWFRAAEFVDPRLGARSLLRRRMLQGRAPSRGGFGGGDLTQRWEARLLTLIVRMVDSFAKVSMASRLHFRREARLSDTVGPGSSGGSWLYREMKPALTASSCSDTITADATLHADSLDCPTMAS